MRVREESQTGDTKTQKQQVDVEISASDVCRAEMLQPGFKKMKKKNIEEAWSSFSRSKSQETETKRNSVQGFKNNARSTKSITNNLLKCSQYFPH